MKFSYPEIETVFFFEDGRFPSLIIENPCLFYRIVDDLCNQVCGEEGQGVLSENDELLPIAGNLDLLTSFFPFEINRKNLLNKVISKLEKYSSTLDFYERSQSILSQIEKFIYDLAYENDFELEFPRLSIGSLLKSSGIRLKEDYPSLVEKLLVYMDLMVSNGLSSIFVFVNLRSFTDDDTIELFTDSCCRKGYNIFLIDNREYTKLSRENRTVVDSDLCEI